VLRVAAASSARAANPFESVLRAIALGVAGLTVAPQTSIRYDDFSARVDLADEDLRIVLEADSHEFHTEPESFARDCWRYDRLVADDWVVLRFPWLHVMNRQAAIHDVLARVVARRQQRCRCGGDRPTTRTQDLPRR
jgi:very-short-patch-repair endonuclease